MRKIILILLAIATLSCSKEDECRCEREVYEFTSSVDLSHGSPHQHFEWVLQRTEPVNCQDEVVEFTEYHDKLYYKIKCN